MSIAIFFVAIVMVVAGAYGNTKDATGWLATPFVSSFLPPFACWVAFIAGSVA